MPDTVAERLAELQSLARPELLRRWERVFGRPAPKRASRDLLLRALAYRIQERAEGGLSKAALKRLTVLARSNGDAVRPAPPRLKPGTRLVREWRGETHHVTVIENGFDYRGAQYASLSRVAREITGTRWSGPVFFGLRKTGGRGDTKPDVH